MRGRFMRLFGVPRFELIALGGERRKSFHGNQSHYSYCYYCKSINECGIKTLLESGIVVWPMLDFSVFLNATLYGC